MATTEEKLLSALKRYNTSRQADREQRLLAIEDLIFIHAEDGQWSEDVVEKRKDRPRYTVDRISGALNQVTGNQRQSRTGLKVIPQKDSSEKTAELMTGLIRSIEEVSNAQNAYDNAFDEQLTGGYGGWRILSDYESEDSFDQTILIKPINSAASSLYFDPSAREYDKRDAEWAFVITSMLQETFREKYPDAQIVDFNQDRYKDDHIRDWFGAEGIRIAEYWYKVPRKRKIGLLSDGRTIDLEEEAAVLDELYATGIELVRERTIDSYDIEMVVMNGAEILTKPQKWPGKYIPLVPVYGRYAVVNDKMYIRGMVRKAKDAQRIYNYATSAAVEATALTPKDPIWITPQQAKGHEAALRRFPTQNSPFLIYNSDPGSPGPPSRGGAPMLQTALIQQVNQAAQDIHSTTGLEPASLGNVPELKSGKAIQAQQAMGDRGAFVYGDNLNKSKRYTGEILVDLIPRIYDTERTVKIMGADEVFKDITINEAEFTDLNQPVIDEETGEQVIVNDLAQGDYSVNVITGPLFSTKRQETVSQLTTLAAAAPIIQELALDVILDNMDLNKGEEIKTRVRKWMIEKGVVEPSEEEERELGLDQPAPPDPINEAMVENLRAQTEKLLIQNEEIISKIEKNDAGTQKMIMDTQKVAVDALKGMMEAYMDKINAGVPVTGEDVEILEGQEAIVLETQADVIENQELAGSAPVASRPQIMPPSAPPSLPGQEGAEIPTPTI